MGGGAGRHRGFGFVDFLSKQDAKVSMRAVCLLVTLIHALYKWNQSDIVLHNDVCRLPVKEDAKISKSKSLELLYQIL